MTELPTNDYISQINKNGSGLNIPQIVGALVEAEITPVRAPVEKKIVKADAAISGLALIKQTSALTNTNIAKLKTGTSFYATTSSDTLQVASSVTDESLVKPGSSKITNITQLATTMSVSVPVPGSTGAVPGYDEPNKALATNYALTIKFGTFVKNGAGSSDTFTHDGATAISLNLASGEGIITAAKKLDAIVGLSAKVVKVGGDTTSNDQYKIMITGEPGLNNGFEISTATTSGNSNARDFDVWNNTNGTAKLRTFEQSAQNLQFKMDGLTLNRESNTVTDAIPGVSFEVKVAGGTGVEIKTEMSKASIQETVQKFIDELNAYKADLTALARRDTTGAEEHGELYGEAYVKSRLDKLSTFLRTPIMGYTSLDKSHYVGLQSNGNAFNSNDGPDNTGRAQTTGNILAIEKNPVHLAQLGFKTQRDGTLILDQRAFDSTFAGDPSRFNALIKDHAYSTNPDVSVTWSPKKPWEGSDAGAVPGIIELHHETFGGSHAFYTRGQRHLHLQAHMQQSGPVNGVYSYTGTNGGTDKLEGLVLTTTKSDIGEDINADVYLGHSFATLFSGFHDDQLNNIYEHRRQVENYNFKRDTLEDRLTAIELRSNSLAQSYNKKFQVMEDSVTGFNSSADYLENFITQWSNS